MINTQAPFCKPTKAKPVMPHHAQVCCGLHSPSRSLTKLAGNWHLKRSTDSYCSESPTGPGLQGRRRQPRQHPTAQDPHGRVYHRGPKCLRCSSGTLGGGGGLTLQENQGWEPDTGSDPGHMAPLPCTAHLPG